MDVAITSAIIGAIIGGGIGAAVSLWIAFRQQKRDDLARSQTKGKAIEAAVEKLNAGHIFVLKELGPQASFPAPEEMARKSQDQRKNRLRKILEETLSDL
jgi:gas vesicle protein